MRLRRLCLRRKLSPFISRMWTWWVRRFLVLELARCEFLARRENVLLLGNSGTGKTHIPLALGLAACQRDHRVRFTTTTALVVELIEARDAMKP